MRINGIIRFGEPVLMVGTLGIRALWDSEPRAKISLMHGRLPGKSWLFGLRRYSDHLVIPAFLFSD